MKIIQQSTLLLAAALLSYACNKPTDTVDTTEAQEVAEVTGTTLSLNSNESTIAWMGYKPAGKHFGKIPATEGFVAVAGNEITGGSFKFDVPGLTIEDMEAGSEFHGKLYNHLQSADFFDAANHPQAIFEITSVEPFASSDQVTDKEEFVSENTPSSDSSLSPKTPTHWVSGNLTMRGITKNIKFPAAISVKNGAVSAKAGFNIDRTAWGLAYGDEATAADKAVDQFIYNSVSLVLDVKAE